MLKPFRDVGRRLRSYILPLVGFWHLLAKLEDLSARVDKLELANSDFHEQVPRLQDRINEISGWLAERLDTLADALSEHERTFITTMTKEVDRLDAYLCYHAAMMRDSATAIRSDHAASLWQGIAAIRGDLYPLRESVRIIAARSQRSIMALGIDALVIDDIFDLIVPASEAELLAHLLRHGHAAIEPGVRALLQHHLKPGAVAVDAGANIGIHAITMASAVGPSGSVLCFEPLPHLAKALERTLRLNGFSDRARVRQAALSDTTGEMTFHRAAHAPMSSLFPLSDETKTQTLAVEVTTLDDSLPPRSRVDLVKMDVEGAEPHIWRGMRRILDENAGIEIILEWSASHFRRSGEDPTAFMTKIRAAGFKPYLIADDETSGSLTPLNSGEEMLEANNLFLTRRPVAPAK